MNYSPDAQVQSFLEDLESFNVDAFEIIMTLRKIVYSVDPGVQERMMYGGIMFSTHEDFGGVFAYTKHVTMEFSKGYLLKDPEHLLQGKGKYRRHLKFVSIEEVEEEVVKGFVEQMVELRN